MSLLSNCESEWRGEREGTSGPGGARPPSSTDQIRPTPAPDLRRDAPAASAASLDDAAARPPCARTNTPRLANNGPSQSTCTPRLSAPACARRPLQPRRLASRPTAPPRSSLPDSPRPARQTTTVTHTHAHTLAVRPRSHEPPTSPLSGTARDAPAATSPPPPATIPPAARLHSRPSALSNTADATRATHIDTVAAPQHLTPTLIPLLSTALQLWLWMWMWMWMWLASMSRRESMRTKRL